MKIIISNKSTIPIYEQIETQIIDAIMQGELKEGDQLPSIRQLARELKVSVMSTTRAFKELEESGYILSVQGKGSYVLARNEELAQDRIIRKIENHFFEILDLAKVVNLDKKKLFELLEKIEEDKDLWR